MTINYTMTIRELAAGIAANIREQGHYQSPGTVVRYGCCTVVRYGCCIVINPAYQDAPFELRDEIKSLLSPHGSLSHWNDHTPTAEVLARLDAIANGTDAP